MNIHRWKCWRGHDLSRWANPWQVRHLDPGGRWQFRKCKRCGRTYARDLSDWRSW